jgi:hypothetical protein
MAATDAPPFHPCPMGGALGCIWGPIWEEEEEGAEGLMWGGGGRLGGWGVSRWDDDAAVPGVRAGLGAAAAAAAAEGAVVVVVEEARAAAGDDEVGCPLGGGGRCEVCRVLV